LLDVRVEGRPPRTSRTCRTAPITAVRQRAGRQGPAGRRVAGHDQPVGATPGRS